MSNAVTSRTFHNRHSKCYYYNERDNYIKYIDIFFNKLLRDYSPGSTFLEQFSDRFNHTAYTGIKFIYSSDREQYKELCIKCAANLDRFLCSNTITHLQDKVIYKDKIKCSIGGRLENKTINVHFCFRSIQEMQKDLDFHVLNNYIYNMIKNIHNDCLIFNVQDDQYLLIRYGETNYTITKRGFLKSIITSKIRKQGQHCSTCKESCKPTFINGLDRLVSII